MRDYCCCSAKHNVYLSWSESDVNVVLYLPKKIICWINRLTQTHNSSNFDFNFHTPTSIKKKTWWKPNTKRKTKEIKKKNVEFREREECVIERKYNLLYLSASVRARTSTSIHSLTCLKWNIYQMHLPTNATPYIHQHAVANTHTHTRRMERLTENEYTQGYYLRLIYTIFIFYRARGVPLVRII